MSGTRLSAHRVAEPKGIAQDQQDPIREVLLAGGDFQCGHGSDGKPAVRVRAGEMFFCRRKTHPRGIPTDCQWERAHPSFSPPEGSRWRQHYDLEVRPRIAAVKLIPEYRLDWEAHIATLDQGGSMEGVRERVKHARAICVRWGIPSLVDPDDPAYYPEATRAEYEKSLNAQESMFALTGGLVELRCIPQRGREWGRPDDECIAVDLTWPVADIIEFVDEFLIAHGRPWLRVKEKREIRRQVKEQVAERRVLARKRQRRRDWESLDRGFQFLRARNPIETRAIALRMFPGEEWDIDGSLRSRVNRLKRRARKFVNEVRREVIDDRKRVGTLGTKVLI